MILVFGCRHYNSCLRTKNRAVCSGPVCIDAFCRPEKARSVQFLKAGVERGEMGLYVTLDEPVNELRKNLKMFGWDTDRILILDATPVAMFGKQGMQTATMIRSDGGGQQSGQQFSNAQVHDFNIQNLLATLQDAILRNGDAGGVSQSS